MCTPAEAQRLSNYFQTCAVERTRLRVRKPFESFRPLARETESGILSATERKFSSRDRSLAGSVRRLQRRAPGHLACVPIRRRTVQASQRCSRRFRFPQPEDTRRGARPGRILAERPVSVYWQRASEAE